MRCQQCGIENNAGASSCRQCGAILANHTCPHCGQVIDADSLFCEYCGRVLSSGLAAAATVVTPLKPPPPWQVAPPAQRAIPSQPVAQPPRQAASPAQQPHPSQPVAPPPPQPVKRRGMPIWLWILIGLLGVTCVVCLVLAIILYPGWRLPPWF